MNRERYKLLDKVYRTARKFLEYAKLGTLTEMKYLDDFWDAMDAVTEFDSDVDPPEPPEAA